MKGAVLVGYMVHSGKTIKYVPNYGGVNFKEQPLVQRPACGHEICTDKNVRVPYHRQLARSRARVPSP
jgi:hypothetical protein